MHGIPCARPTLPRTYRWPHNAMRQAQYSKQLLESSQRSDPAKFLLKCSVQRQRRPRATCGSRRWRVCTEHHIHSRILCRRHVHTALCRPCAGDSTSDKLALPTHPNKGHQYRDTEARRYRSCTRPRDCGGFCLSQRRRRRRSADWLVKCILPRSGEGSGANNSNNPRKGTQPKRKPPAQEEEDDTAAGQPQQRIKHPM